MLFVFEALPANSLNNGKLSHHGVYKYVAICMGNDNLQKIYFNDIVKDFAQHKFGRNLINKEGH